MFNFDLGIQNILNSSDTPAKKLARFKNNLSFMNTYIRSLNLAQHRYKFSGLPDTIKQQDICRYLLYHGNVILFEQAGAWFCLPGGGMQNININGKPGTAWIYGANGYNKEVNLAIPGGFSSSFARKGLSGGLMKESDKAFLIRENYCNYPFVNYCLEIAEAVADTMRTLDVVRKNIKHPYVFTAEQSIVNTIKSFFNKRDNNEEFIIDSGVFPADKIKMLPLDQNPECIKVSTDLIEWYWNLFFELCGFNSNSNPDKKAQLTTVEVNANNDAIALQASSVIETLQEDLDFFNEFTGLQIKVERTDLSEYNEDMELNSTQLNGEKEDVRDKGNEDV